MRKQENPKYKDLEYKRQRSKRYYARKSSMFTDFQHNYKRQNRTELWLKRIQVRARMLNVDFDLTEEDLIIPEKCPLLNIPLFFIERGRSDNTPSVDRIENTKGYLKGNVQIISYRANQIKNNASIVELETLLENLKRIQGN